MSNNILITGASSDLALAYIKSYGRRYDCIAAHYCSNSDALSKLSEEGYGNIIPLKADFSSEQSTGEFIKALDEINLDITHILHCPSAKFSWTHYSKLNWDNFRLLLDTQLRSFYYITNHCLPKMAKSKYGKVTAVLSSVTSDIPPAYASHYVTAKYALLGLVKSLSSEYASKHITINAVSPCTMETKFNSDNPRLLIEKSAAENPAGRNAVPADVIPTLDFLLSDCSDFITGQNICVTGGTKN